MALQLSVRVRNAILDAIETTVGTSPKLQLRTGTPPANCAAADSGTLVVEIPVPSDWLANASSGSKALSGTWAANVTTAGTPGHFRLKDSGGTNVDIQGTVATSSADMITDTAALTVGQLVSVNGFTLSAANS